MPPLNQVFSALADPTRRGIVLHLARNEATVTDLVKRFELTQPTISAHLKVLEKAGLISRRRLGQSRPCVLERKRLREVAVWLQQVQQVWEGNYRKLDALLDELKRTSR